MKQIKLNRSGKRPLVFNGTRIASASTRTHNSTRWTDVDVYETEACKIVVSISHITCWEGERDSFSVEVFNTKEEAVTYLEEVCERLVENIADKLGVWESAINNIDSHHAVCGKVVIEVRGGVAYLTSAPENVEVEIIDHDNEKHQ